MPALATSAPPSHRSDEGGGLCAALSGCACCRACDRERVDGLNGVYFTQGPLRLMPPYYQPDIVPPI